MNITLSQLVKATDGRFISGNPHASLQRLSIDSRTFPVGALYWAIPGSRYDGHDFISDVARQGAAAVVIQTLDGRLHFEGVSAPAVIQVPESLPALQNLARFLRRQSQATFIGLTGTNGKTTSKEMIAAILSRAGKTLSTRGNLNNHIGVPLMMTELEPDHRFVVLEMGASREGDLALLADIGQPSIGLITNIGKAHLEHLKSPQGVLAVKRALWDALPADGTAVVNADDPLLAEAAGSLKCKLLRFSQKGPADVTARDVKQEGWSVRFTLTIGDNTSEVRMSVPGLYQVSNALGAAAVAHAAGVSLIDIVEGLQTFKPAAMRMQVLKHPGGAVLVNDAYNANPSSVRASVQGFSAAYDKQAKWLVLGDMRELGDTARQEHRELGRWLRDQSIDKIFLYGRDTRFVLEGLGSGPSVKRFRKKTLLLAELKKSIAQKPAVLFKGSRAMKLEDVVNPLLQG